MNIFCLLQDISGTSRTFTMTPTTQRQATPENVSTLSEESSKVWNTKNLRICF